MSPGVELQQMNVYDFDHTIYRGDSTLDFWWYCVRRYPVALKALPKALTAGACFRLGRCDRETFKETFYHFLCYLPDAETAVQAFWDSNLKKIQPWYLDRKMESDLVISASPAFLISEACLRLNIHWIASQVDCHTGKLQGPNCRGYEKVNRLYQKYPQAVVEDFFSDSSSDKPMACIAVHAYRVEGSKIRLWQEGET